MGWSLPRWKRARDALVKLGFIRCIHPGGNGPHDPPIYTWELRGTILYPIRNRHPSPLGREAVLLSLMTKHLDTKTALKMLILRHPDWSTDDLMAELAELNFPVPTRFCVSCLRSRFKDDLRFLKQAGVLMLMPAQLLPFIPICSLGLVSGN